MTASPRERLAGALAVQLNLVDVAQRAGVSPRAIHNAVEARPVNASDFLRMAAVVGFNPCPTLAHHFPAPGDFLFGMFGLGFALKRHGRHLTTRQAGKFLDVTAATIHRIERGDAMSIGVVLRACQFIGLSPFGYVAVQQKAPHGIHPSNSPNVSRETSPV